MAETYQNAPFSLLPDRRPPWKQFVLTMGVQGLALFVFAWAAVMNLAVLDPPVHDYHFVRLVETPPPEIHEPAPVKEIPRVVAHIETPSAEVLRVPRARGQAEDCSRGSARCPQGRDRGQQARAACAGRARNSEAIGEDSCLLHRQLSLTYNCGGPEERADRRLWRSEWCGRASKQYPGGEHRGNGSVRSAYRTRHRQWHRRRQGCARRGRQHRLRHRHRHRGRQRHSRGGVQKSGFGDTQAVSLAQLRPKQTDDSAGKMVPAEVVFKPTPAYTPEARNLRIEGEVVLEVVFEATGKLRVVRVVQGLGHGLDENATHAAEQIRFKPAKRDGQPSDYTALVHIVFQLGLEVSPTSRAEDAPVRRLLLANCRGPSPQSNTVNAIPNICRLKLFYLQGGQERPPTLRKKPKDWAPAFR